VYCKFLQHDGRNDLIVYLNKIEAESDETKELLENMKKQYENIIIFTSGEESLENVICRLIRDEQTDDSSSG
jgi:hypothetical protein